MSKAAAKKRLREAASKVTNVMLADPSVLTTAQYSKMVTVRRDLLNLVDKL